MRTPWAYVGQRVDGVHLSQMRVAPVVASMQTAGVPIHYGRLLRAKSIVDQRAKVLRHQLRTFAANRDGHEAPYDDMDFQPDNDAWVEELCSDFGLPLPPAPEPTAATTGGISTTASNVRDALLPRLEAVLRLVRPGSRPDDSGKADLRRLLPEVLLEYRQRSTPLLRSFHALHKHIESGPGSGAKLQRRKSEVRIHPRYSMLHATGRVTATRPALQQLPASTVCIKVRRGGVLECTLIPCARRNRHNVQPPYQPSLQQEVEAASSHIAQFMAKLQSAPAQRRVRGNGIA